MFSKIDHVALHVKNAEASSQFYIDNFGFKNLYKTITKKGNHIIYLQLGGTILELIDSFSDAIQGCHFCLHAPDFNKAYEFLLQANIKVLQPPHSTDARLPTEVQWMRAVFLGPDGEHIEIRG